VNLLVSLEAGLDIAEAVEFLRDRSPQLPTRFRQSLERSYSSIVEHPAMFPVVHRQFRRALLRHFPYAIFYVIEPEAIVIMGVVHQARHPSTWQRRA
jgi:plasmid stabilization system protein ParE